MAGTQRALAFQACSRIEFTDRHAEAGQFYGTACLLEPLLQRIQPLIDELQFTTLKIQQLRLRKPPDYWLQVVLEENVRKGVTRCLKEVLQLDDES